MISPTIALTSMPAAKRRKRNCRSVSSREMKMMETAEQAAATTNAAGACPGANQNATAQTASKSVIIRAFITKVWRLSKIVRKVAPRLSHEQKLVFLSQSLHYFRGHSGNQTFFIGQ